MQPQRRIRTEVYQRGLLPEFQYMEPQTAAAEYISLGPWAAGAHASYPLTYVGISTAACPVSVAGTVQIRPSVTLIPLMPRWRVRPLFVPFVWEPAQPKDSGHPIPATPRSRRNWWGGQVQAVVLYNMVSAQRVAVRATPTV